MADAGGSRRLALDAVALGAVALACLYACRGWALAPGYVFPEQDTLFCALAVDHLQSVLLHGGDWRESGLGWPLTAGTTRTDWMLGQALVGLAVRPWGAMQVTRVLAFTGVATSAGALYVAARALGLGRLGAVAAAVAGGLGGQTLLHAQHVNLVFHAPGVIGAVGVVAGRERGRPALVGLGVASGALSTHFGLYAGLHAAFLVAGAVAVGVARTGRGGWGRPALVGLACLATCAPVADLYLGAAARFGASVERHQLGQDGWDPVTTLAPVLGSIPEGLAAAKLGLAVTPSVNPGNPGWGVLLLALPGLVWAPRSWRWLSVGAAVAATLALGGAPVVAGWRLPVPGPHRALEWVSGGNLREPARWLVLVHYALGLYAGWTVDRLGAAWRGGSALGLAASLGVLLEAPSFAGASARAAVDPVSGAAVYDGLATGDPGPLAEVFRRGDRCPPAASLLAALDHHRPLVGGLYARSVPALDSVNGMVNLWPSEETVAFLRWVGVPLVLVHGDRRLPPAGVSCIARGTHSLCSLGPVDPIAAGWEVGGEGPVLAIRMGRARPKGATITCDGAVRALPLAAAAALQKVRTSASLDVPLTPPCGVVSDLPRGATALHAALPGAWLPR